MNYDEQTLKLIMEDEVLKAAYSKTMLKELQLRELSARTNYDALKIKVTQAKNESKDKLKPEIF